MPGVQEGDREVENLAAPLGLFGIALERTGGVGRFVRNIWEKLAFATRYGHQPLDVLFTLDSSDLQLYVEALAELIEAESQKSPVSSFTHHYATGG